MSDLSQLTANHLSTITNLTNADATLAVATSQRYRLPVSTLTADRTATLSVTGASTNDTMTIIRDDLSIYNYYIVDAYSSTILYKLSGSKTVSFTFDGTKWVTYQKDNWDGSKVLNARDFGAKGDGVVDDTTALQNLLNIVPTLSSAVLEIPHGTYKITKGLVLKSTDYFRTIKLKGSLGGGIASKGTILQWAGAAEDDDAFLLSKATSTSVQSYSGAGIDGVQGTTVLSDPRPILVTLTGSSSDFVNNSTITVVFKTETESGTQTSTWVQTINTSQPFPQRYWSQVYASQIVSVSISAQATTAGTVKVGFLNGTMLRTYGLCNSHIEDLEFHGLQIARCGVHIMFNHVNSIGSTTNWWRRLGTYAMYDGYESCGLQIGQIDPTFTSNTWQVDNQRFYDCYFGGGIDYTKKGSGVMQNTGGNCELFTFENCNFGPGYIGANMPGNNAIITAFNMCNFTGVNKWCITTGGCFLNVTNAHAEGGGGGFLYTQGTNNSVTLKQVTGWNSVVDNVIVQTGQRLEMESCSWYNTREGGTAKILAGNHVASKNCAYSVDVNGDYSYPPLYESGGTYRTLDRSISQYYVVNNFNYKETSSYGDYAINGSGISIYSWRPMSTYPVASTQAQFIKAAIPLWGKYYPPTSSRCWHTLTFTHTDVNLANGYASFETYLYVPAGWRVVGCYVKTATTWAHPSATDIKLSVGEYYGTKNEFILSNSIKTAGTVVGSADAELGSALARSTSVQGGYIPNAGWDNAWTLCLTFTITGGTAGTFTAGKSHLCVLVEGPGTGLLRL